MSDAAIGQASEITPNHTATDAPGADSSRLTLDPVLSALIAIAVVGIVLALVKLSASILSPILLGWFIAALAYPLFRRLEARLFGRPLALLGTAAIITMGVVGLVMLLMFSASTLTSGLSGYAPQVSQRVEEASGALPTVEVSAEARAAASAFLDDVMKQLAVAVLGALGDLVFAVVLASLLLLQAGRFARLLSVELREVPFLGQLPKVMHTVVRYLGIRTRLNLMTGAGMTVFLVVLGVDYAALWGLLVFFLSYVPYIGLFAAMIPPVLLAWAESGASTAMLCIVAAVVVNLTIENVVEPGYTGRRLRLSPPVVFVAFFVFVWLLGPLGAALSMPMTVLIVLVSGEYRATRWLALMLTGGLGDSPAGQANAESATSGGGHKRRLASGSPED